MKQSKDTLTLDIFDLPTPEVVIPGESQYAREVSETVSLVLSDSGLKDRYEISSAVSRMADKDVSKHMLDAYCSAARVDHPLPFWLAPILETVCTSHRLTDWLVSKRGGRVAYGEDAVDAEIGKLQMMKKQMQSEINEQIHKLEKMKGLGK